MRVPTISTYHLATYQLGTITEDLKDANEVMSTQKDINSLSDNPIGLTQVMNLNVSIENLEQIETNVHMGTTWLSGVESALDSVSDLIMEMKTDVLQLANASTGIDQRRNAVERVDSIIDQIVSLGNTQVNGNYLFSGTRTDTLPLEYKQDAEPLQVLYYGDETPFQIRSDKNEEVAVGMVGKETFKDNKVAINTTNNTIVFKEDPDYGPDYERLITATVPDGDYDKKSLAAMIKKTLNEASSEDGYGLTYDVSYDEDTQKFSIVEDGSYEGFMRTEFFWETGTAAYEDAGLEGGPFLTEIQTGGTITLESIDARVVNPDALEMENDEESLRLNWDGEDTWILDTVESSITPSKVETLDDNSIELYFDDNDIPAVTIQFNDALNEDDFVEFKINREVTPELDDTSIGHEIGFVGADMITEPISSDTEAKRMIITSVAPFTNNGLEFSINGGALLTATIPDGYYSGKELAAELEYQMNTEASASGSTTSLSVNYDSKLKRYTIQEDGSTMSQIDLYWSNAGSTVSTALGYNNAGSGDDDSIIYPQFSQSDYNIVSVPISADNNKIDFHEVIDDGQGGQRILDLSASVKIKPDYTAVPPYTRSYRSHDELAKEVEKALEAESLENGNGINYSVSWDTTTEKFTIKENGTRLDEFSLLWQSGENAPVSEGGTGKSIGSIMGFDAEDDTKTPLDGTDEVEWGIFNTLLDLRGYLENNDVDGIERTIGRLDTSYENMTSIISETGMKYTRLQIRESLTTEMNLYLTERRSSIEDADIVEATMKLTSVQSAYEAALKSTSKIINISLMDYM